MSTQTIQITSAAPPLDTESPAVSTVVNSTTIDGLPLNGRNVLNLIALTNGVVPQAAAMGSPSGNANGGTATIFGNIMNFQIGGGQNNQSAVFLDGAPLNIGQSNSTALAPTQDAVQEFRVVSSNASAEFGKFAGGVVNLTTKSGSNAFHGGIYEFFRNKVLNANAFFNNLAGLPRPQWNQNQYGANLGGPITKNKLFFFFAWENFDYNIEVPSVSSAPTQRMRNGEFSESGVPTIYDPQTVCGFYGNHSCPVVNGSPVYTRQPFPDNRIPLSRISPYSLFIEDAFPLPNRPGLANNYFRNQPAGGPEHQYNGRGDWNLTDKNRLYARYTYWNVYQRPSIPFPPPARQGDVGSRFEWQTHQAVIGDSYVLSPTTLVNIRASFLRNTNSSIPLDFPVDLSQWGNGYAPLLSQLDGPVEPQTNIQGFFGAIGGFGPQTGRNNLYVLSGDVAKTMGRHTIKFGGETRDAQVNRFQLNPAGAFVYNNGFTSQNPLASGNTGYGMASFLLGLAASGSTKVSLQTANAAHYSGLYVADTFQASRKLTLTAGLRWDLPFSYTERYDRIGVFNPGATNPLAQATGLPLKGAVDYVNSSADPYRSVYNPHYNLFAPRLGLAYRFTPFTVVRLGYAISYAPNDTNEPDTNTVNSATTTFVASLNGGITPYNTPADPYPTGLIPAAGRDAAQLLVTTQGQTITAPLSDIRYPSVQQWNVTIGRDLGHGMVVEASYVGLKGTHLAIAGSANLNQLPDRYNSMGQALLTQVPNPFLGQIAIGPLANVTVNAGQLLRPYPQYQNVLVPFRNVGNSTYNSFQSRFEKRFNNLGTLMVNYTWSKLLSDVGTASVIGTFASPGGTNGIQDWNDISSAKALDPNNASQRLVISYVYDLPIGRGRALLGSARGVINDLVSGWGVSGVTTIQSGFPLSITYGGNNVLNSTFGAGTIRPNVIAGCQKSLPGSAVDRFNAGKWFNTSCFTAPSAFGFGDEAAYDPELRGQGITNVDLAIIRKFVIRERCTIQFRGESFNLANHTRFANPGTVMGTPTFGVVTANGSSQQNQPRLIQLALRISF